MEALVFWFTQEFFVHSKTYEIDITVDEFVFEALCIEIPSSDLALSEILKPSHENPNY